MGIAPRACGWLLGAAWAVLAAAPVHGETGAPTGRTPATAEAPAGQAAAEAEAESDATAGAPVVPAAPASDPASAGSLVGEGAEATLDRAWRHGEASLSERARRLRSAALQAGIWSLDPAGRALLREESLGSFLERAEAAALLAPELPAAHGALALARLRAVEPGGALDAFAAAAGSLVRHPEASIWLRASALDAASRAALAGGLGFLLVAGLGAAAGLVPALAVRLGAPSASAAAALGALLLVPAAAGQGLLGVALLCGGLAVARGGLAGLAAVVGAGLLAAAGLHPLAAARDAALAPLALDPVGWSAASAERDLASPLELARLERAAPGDPFARRALALHARRSGDFAGADERFRALLAEGGARFDLLNNAANARLASGSAQEALELYERAVHERPSPLVLFNLAQVYGKAILLDEQDLALKQAQALDARAVHALTRLVAEVGGGGPVDVPLDAGALRERVAAQALPLRGEPSPLAPGVLGRSPVALLAALAAACALGVAVRRPLRRFAAGDDFHAGLARGLQSDEADPARRVARLSALRARQGKLDRLRRAAALAVPGAAGLQAGQAPLGLAAVALAAGAVVFAGARAGVVPDPFAAGAAGTFVFVAAGAVAAGGYVAVTSICLSILRARR